MYKPGIETKTKIINAGKQMFYEKGYISTTINAIMTAAGLRRTLFFYYFKDSLDLASQIYDEMQNNHFKLVNNFIKDLHLNNLQRTCVEVTSHHRLVLSDKNLSRFVSEISFNGILLKNEYIKSHLVELINENLENSEMATVEYINAQNLALSAMIFRLNSEGNLQTPIDKLISLKTEAFLKNMYFKEPELKKIKDKVLNIEAKLKFVVKPYFEVEMAEHKDLI